MADTGNLSPTITPHFPRSPDGECVVVYDGSRSRPNLFVDSSTGRAGRKRFGEPSHLSGNDPSLPFLAAPCVNKASPHRTVLQMSFPNKHPIRPSTLSFNHLQVAWVTSNTVFICSVDSSRCASASLTLIISQSDRNWTQQLTVTLASVPGLSGVDVVPGRQHRRVKSYFENAQRANLYAKKIMGLWL